ncbi:recombinase family protein [Nocardioides bizhenqiangii]|uniref:Recombinase family protein n=1 Tax=Nocardioides bizhenqiangii TaxID=3095076 RepID=A0ABZ0ZTI0_9ACTN|nr:recombinase family protein [Nocardioides sp. HM61]WQQ26813.1 recombinase family protein [Nocardioides sp. HM61]
MRPLAAIYVRISRDKEGKGLGVGRQEADCRLLAEKLGFDVADVYDDNDFSATKTKPRPRFEQLMEDAKSGKFSAVLTWHTDRLYRRPADLHRLIAVLKPRDIPVYTVKAGALDLTTSSGRMQAGIFAEIAQHEVELKAERQKRKELELAQSGEPRTSSRAFGFEPDGRTWRQPEAEMIQQATADVLAGTSLAEIIRRWNASGYKTARGRDDWTHGRVRAVLTRWKNAGVRERNIYDGNKIVDTELYPGTWEPLVSRAELEAVRNLLFDPKRRTGPGNHVRKHLLSFFLTCGACGHPLRAGNTQSYGKRHLTYQCGGKHTTAEGKTCWSSISYAVAEETVRDHIAKRLALPDASLFRATNEDREAFEANHEARARLESDRARIHELKLDRVDKAVLLAEVAAELDALAEQFERLAQRGALAETMRGFTRIEDAEVPEEDSSTGKAVDLTKLIGNIKAARSAARERFDALELSTQRQILEALVRVIILPATPGRQYRGNRELSAERVEIVDLDPKTGEPLPEELLATAWTLR